MQPLIRRLSGQLEHWTIVARQQSALLQSFYQSDSRLARVASAEILAMQGVCYLEFVIFSPSIYTD
jgi:predicted lipoprotein